MQQRSAFDGTLKSRMLRTKIDYRAFAEKASPILLFPYQGYETLLSVSAK